MRQQLLQQQWGLGIEVEGVVYHTFIVEAHNKHDERKFPFACGLT